jgi:CheY-like chemotaxis protein
LDRGRQVRGGTVARTWHCRHHHKLAGPHERPKKELITQTADLFLLGSAAAAGAAFILTMRSNRARTDDVASQNAPAAQEPSPERAKVASGDEHHELLAAWVQFLKADILEAVNALHNRLNVIAHTAAEATSNDHTPELSQALTRIRSEGERAAKITTGLLSRVDALAPDTVPPVVFEFDGSRLPSGRILLVEDDEANRNVLSKVLRRLGQEVTPVANGFDAFTVLESVEADCIICDIKLPYLDGRTLFEQVEQRLPHLASRFVFVTGDYTNPGTLSFLKLSGQPYVGKPYELEALLGAVAVILRNRSKDGSEPVTRDN